MNAAYLGMNKEINRKKGRRKSYTRKKLESKKKRKWDIKVKKKKVEGRQGNEKRKKKGMKKEINEWKQMNRRRKL